MCRCVGEKQGIDVQVRGARVGHRLAAAPPCVGWVGLLYCCACVFKCSYQEARRNQLSRSTGEWRVVVAALFPCR